MHKKKIKINIIIIFSCIFSILLSIYYINTYDSYQLNNSTHIMLKEETFAHWYRAALILDQIKNGTSFFVAGEEVFTKPLPQRLVALYSYILNFNIIDNWDSLKISLGGKLPFLIIQSLFYFLSIIIFFKHISEYFNENINLFIIIFLCLEPTIFQYHSSFWTESVYFSIQLLILSLVLSKNNHSLKFVVIGLLLGLLFMQRSAGIFYIIIVVIYFAATLKEKKYQNIFLILVSYLFVCFILGFHNYKRIGTFYVMPTEGKYGMYKYFAKNVLMKSNEISIDEVNRLEVKKSLEWIKNNLPEINYKDYTNIKSPFEISKAMDNETYRIKFYKYINGRAYKILIDNPVITLKEVLNGLLHFSILNPFFVYYDYEYYKNYASNIIGDFVYSEEHRKLIPLRIVYTIILFVICLLGVYECIRKNLKLTIFLLTSILYYYLVLGWYGKTRLFVPCLIYMSVFFGFGIDFIRKKIIKISYS